MVDGDHVSLCRFLLYVNLLPYKCSSACGCALVVDEDEEEGWATVAGDDREDGKIKKNIHQNLAEVGEGASWGGVGLGL